MRNNDGEWLKNGGVEMKGRERGGGGRKGIHMAQGSTRPLRNDRDINPPLRRISFANSQRLIPITCHIIQLA